MAERGSTPQTSPFETDGRHVVRNGVRVATCKDVPEAAWIASACNRELAASSETSTSEKEQAASDILLALVGLKLYKDTEGKDAWYEAEQPKAWAIAREYLEHAMPEEYAIVVREIGARRTK